jgi:hypothetical protein
VANRSGERETPQVVVDDGDLERPGSARRAHDPYVHGANEVLSARQTEFSVRGTVRARHATASA